MSFSDDEDVIYQGSPVYESLVLGGSVGKDLEFEVCNRGELFSTDTQDKALADDIKKICVAHTPYTQRWTNMYKKMLNFLGITSAKELTQWRAVEIIEHLMLSSNIEDDDVDFLRAYLKIPQLSTPQGSVRSYVTGVTLLTMPVLCAFGLFTFKQIESDWWSMLGSLAMTCAIGVTLPFAALYMLNINKSMGHRRGLDTEHQVVNDHVKMDEDFSTALKRSLRLIQEKELIARGFTLVSQKNPISRLEEGSSLTVTTRQCPGLRKLVFLTARQAIYFYRDVTRQLINIKSVASECDVRSSYLAYEPLQSYGPCLQPSITEDDNELYTITDGFSVSALKGICHLLRLHQSEFLKALALVYSHSLQNPDFKRNEVMNLLQTSDHKLKDWVNTIKESYDFHNCSLLSQKSYKKLPSQSSHIADVQTAIHSLDLHLQSALTRVQTFSTWLETKAGDSDMKSICCQGDDIVKNIMEPIRAELDSCKGCWEESNIRIERMMGKNNEGPKEDKSGPGISLDEKESTEVQSKEPEDYIIVDQVFEAYTDPNDLNEDENGWDKPLTAEEKEKLRREKREALRMLTELKSVISVRAVDMEKRERAALLRAHPELILDTAYDSQIKREKSATWANSDKQRDDKKVVEIVNHKTGSTLSLDHNRKTINTNEKDKHLDTSCSNPKSFIEGQKELSAVENQLLIAPSGFQEMICEKSVEKVETDFDALNTDLNASDISKDIDERFDEAIDTTEIDEDEVNHIRNPLSYVSSQGVRRLRKSNMLDLSDSDSDAEVTRGEEIFSNKLNIHDEKSDKSVNFDLLLVNRGSPLMHERGDSCDSDEEIYGDNIEDFTAKPPLSFKERLSQLSGANLDISSSIASQAVAKSLQMGIMPESTFGGEVFGELSSSESEDEA